MKSVKIWQQHPVPEGLLKFLFLESSNGKILLLEASDLDCFYNFYFESFLIQSILLGLLDQKFEFLGESPDPDFSFDLLYKIIEL